MKTKQLQKLVVQLQYIGVSELPISQEDKNELYNLEWGPIIDPEMALDNIEDPSPDMVELLQYLIQNDIMLME